MAAIVSMLTWCGSRQISFGRMRANHDGVNSETYKSDFSDDKFARP